MLLERGRFRFGDSGCEREAFRPPSWWGTTNQSGEMPHTRGLLVKEKIFVRNVRFCESFRALRLERRAPTNGL